jgi:uncharacterized membrane protein (UPF0127 family)
MTASALALMLLLAPLASAAPAARRHKAAACRPQTVRKKTVMVTPKGAKIRADVVDTPKERETGLMCRTRLPKDYGMLFVFPADISLGFWMKHTLVSLDILWIGADKRITTIAPRLKASTLDEPDSKVATARGRGQYVLELPAGAAERYGLKVGDALDFSADIPLD